jgi:hypothetical protein
MVVAMRIASAVLLFALVGSVLAPGGAAAQQSPEERLAATRARAQAELDRLTPLLDAARRQWSAADQLRKSGLGQQPVEGTDTIQVGPFRVMVQDGKGDEARPYFEKAWARYSVMLDGQEWGLPRRMFAFQHGFVLKNWELPTWTIRIERNWGRPEQIQRAVDDAVASALSVNLPKAQREWASDRVGFEPDFEAVHRELVLGVKPPTIGCSGCSPKVRLASHAFSQSAPLVACRAGDTDACWNAFGATGNVDFSQDLALWHGRDAPVRWVEPLGQGCGRDHPAYCEEALSFYWDELAPLGDASKASLVSVALEMGGRGSLIRFKETRGYHTNAGGNRELGEATDYREILSSAADASPDAVMSEWLRRVQAAKPDRAETDKEARFGAILWITLFIALATRSTRWRLG